MADGRALRALRATGQRVRRLGWREWGALVEATLCLGVVRAAIVLVRFPALSRLLGTPRRESTHDDDPARQHLLRRVQWAIAAVSHRAPWRCMCLEQAIAARLMLRVRGTASTLYLGVARAAAEEGEARSSRVEAHAWLRCGSQYVTGGAGRARFTVVSTFAD